MLKTLVFLLASVMSLVAQNFDFRDTAGYVTDPPGNIAVLSTTTYPTVVNGVTFGWLGAAQSRDRSTTVDPRLAGVNFVPNGTPVAFEVDLAPGTYNLSLASGDEGFQSCWAGCSIQLVDGTNVLATLPEAVTQLGFFFDATGANYSAAAWPTSNTTIPITLVNGKLKIILGTTTASGDSTPIAFLGIAAVSNGGTITVSNSYPPGSTVVSTITLTPQNGWTSDVTMSLGTMPAGVIGSFNPTVVSGGVGTSILTMQIATTGSSPGAYQIPIIATGGGVQNTTSLELDISASTGMQAKKTGAKK